VGASIRRSHAQLQLPGDVASAGFLSHLPADSVFRPWIVWSGGNDRFWDTISRKSVGTPDFLETLSSHPSLKFSRDNRWKYLGLVNEPCFEKATGPDPTRFGSWLWHMTHCAAALGLLEPA
jgi:hypothetical protein